eukprot:960173-Rhodomonas_salina.1
MLCAAVPVQSVLKTPLISRAVSAYARAVRIAGPTAALCCWYCPTLCSYARTIGTERAYAPTHCPVVCSYAMRSTEVGHGATPCAVLR